MAGIHKPTALLTPDAFKRNPKRARTKEPIPTGLLGNPPDHLTEADKAAWHELAGIAPPKVLTNADRWLVEIACRIMARVRTFGIGGQGGVSIGELAQFNNCLARMGLTPVDRARISVTKDEESRNPFASLDDEICSHAAN